MTETIFDKSVAFAIKVHEGQKRKEKDVPYITHIYDVIGILQAVTSDSEIWSAGALHDTVEDCRPYGSVTLAIIAELAGARVARMVGDVTEPDKTLAWEVRKQQALEHIGVMQEDSLLVKSADTLSNLKSMAEALRTMPHDEFFSRFNSGRDAVITSYIKRVEALDAAWPENPLLPRIQEKLSEILTLIS